MTSAIAPAHAYLIIDACGVINLAASGHMKDILVATRQSIAVATYVRDVEALRIDGRMVGGVKGPDERIDLQPLIDDGLLELVQPDSEAEDNTFVDFAVEVDDGEAITGAIAVHRGWAIGTDDKDARRLLARVAPHLQLVSTPEFIKHWADQAQPSPDIIRAVLGDIRARGHYAPPKQHQLRGWWTAHETP